MLDDVDLLVYLLGVILGSLLCIFVSLRLVLAELLLLTQHVLVRLLLSVVEPIAV